EIMCGDGKRRTIDLTSTSLTLGDGTRAIMSIAVEVAQQAPAATGERGYRELVEASPDVLMRFDPGGRLLFVNHALERLTAQPPEAFVADDGLWLRTIAPEYRQVWQSAFLHATKGNGRAFDLGLDVPGAGETRRLIMSVAI